MLHPFSEDTTNLTVSQLQEKISDLTKKYFQATQSQVREQISTFIEYYKQEARIKEEKSARKPKKMAI